MIRLDQRNADVQGTERVFKKVVHGGHNALRFVDKNGLPMRPPNTATLSRLHSTYVLSPRGVPTRKSNHSYSGQLTQAKMQNMVNSLETSSQEMASYASMHSYGNGLSSAGSSRHYLSTANSQKQRTFGPARSAKTMNKSASSQRTHRMLVSAPELEITNNDPNQEATNDSPQGKRLGKEWSALSQCRALKRSSEIVSHRVDRMYFMSGNKLKLQGKYQVEEDDLQHLRELQAARASSRSSRSGRSKGDVYRPHSLKTDMSNGDLEVGLVVSDEARRANRLKVENGHKENRDPKVIVSQKTLTPRPHSSNKSPIQGWDDNASEKGTTIANGIPNETLHDNDGEEEAKEQNEEGKETEVIKTDAIDNPDNDQGKENGNKDIKAENNDNEKEVHESNDINGNDDNTEKDIVENKVTVDIDDLVVVTGKKTKGKGNVVEETMGNTNDEKSVQKTEGTSEETDDKDQTDVKSEDYLGK